MKTDAQIQKDVMEELSWDPSITHEHIGVSVNNGIVTLFGTVPTYSEKFSAEAAAQRVLEVKGVVEKIEVKLTESNKRTDEDIARAALDALKWNTRIPANRIKVTVQAGRVELSGDVDWEYQRIAAENAVKYLNGVTWVMNSISIQSKINPTDVKSKIEQALKRSAEREASRINIEVSGSKVILSGSARSLAEVRDAKSAAWSAPGVTQVENNIKIAA